MFDAHTHLHHVPTPRSYPHALHYISTSAVHPADWVSLSRYLTQTPSMPHVLPTFGLHPWHAEQALDTLEDFLLRYPNAPLGECGLCGLRTEVPRALQPSAFTPQLQLAQRLSRAIIIHAARAWSAVFDVLRAQPPPRALLLHAFSANESCLKDALKFNTYFSMGPMILNPNATKLCAMAARIPAERLVIETDAETQEQLTQLPLILARLAAIRQVTVEELDLQTTRAAKEFYQCP